MKEGNISKNSSNRILSIDVFRGITMFLLIGEFTQIMPLLLHHAAEGSFVYAFAEQFHHHPWNGLRFWDLIQPYFMFIVGLSLPFAVLNRQKKGESKQQIFAHISKRAAILLFLGWALYCIGPGKITFYFQNVLAQIAVTYLIAYLIMNKSFTFQIVFSIGLLLLTEVAYRFFSVAGFDHPFVLMENFGTWLDLQYNGVSHNGWATINAIPTAAHTIWGVLVGKLLMSDRLARKKLTTMILVGVMLVITGYLMNSFTPIIKRIATSSFVIVSGGWTILTLAFLFWLVDMVGFKGKWTTFFSVVGMNSLFIYLFTHIGGANLIEQAIHPFTYSFFNTANVYYAKLLTGVFVWAALWGICYWMYKKKIFIKI